MMNQDQYHSAQSDKVFYVNDAKEKRSIPSNSCFASDLTGVTNLFIPSISFKMLYCYTCHKFLFILFTSGQIKLTRQ